ncbi:MAG TPA: hypothetical protein V6D47_11410 [Oscillatoriaceae cyanobacterium]
MLTACGLKTPPDAPVTRAPTPSPGLAPMVLPTATDMPSPTSSPSPTTGRYIQDFEALSVGAKPADFVDVASETSVPSWVYQGNWHVATDETGNHVLLHDAARQQPALSFYRYRGDALGLPNGQMPPVYYAEAVMRPISSPNNYPPTGDQGVQFYYLSVDTYLEVVIKPTQLEIWQAEGAAPKSTQGWTRLWAEDLTTNGGDRRRIGALVNVPAGTFTAYLDGKPLHTVKSDLLKPQPSWITLRAIGNVVSFDNLLIEKR